MLFRGSQRIKYIFYHHLYPLSSFCKGFLYCNPIKEPTLSGEIKKAHARVYSTYTCALLYLNCMQTLSSCQNFNHIIPNKPSPLSPKENHGIINCRRRQLAVTCRCWFTCSCLRVVRHSQDTATFLISTYL